MQILVINSGSSSLKFRLVRTGTKYTELAQGLIDGIGLKSCKFTFKTNDKNIGQKFEAKNHKAAIKLALDTLLKTETIKSLKEIDTVGHRVVHGGSKYTEPTKIDAKVIKEIKKLAELAPLHNPANLEGILAIKHHLPKTPQVAIFDTAFHQTLPPKAYTYPLPHDFTQKHEIHRYGFHGINHRYVTEEAIRQLKRKNLKIVSCHLGNGSSITASINGKSIDTSMGFTPLEGLMMGTRTGSIDPAIIFHLKDQLKIKIDDIEHMIRNESGLLGVSEISSDMRDIYAASLRGNKQAIFTIELLAYQLAKYIGAYTAAMNGLDAIIFTATLAEKAFYVRKQACEYLSHLGVQLDKRKNEKCEPIISSAKSKVKVLIIPANEGKQIATETEKLLKKSKRSKH